MITADYVSIAVILFTILLGSVLGFGRLLRIVASGWTGKIISVVICYFLFGIVLNWGFVQDLLNSFLELFGSEGFFAKLCRTIRLDVIVFAIVLFISVQILRKITVGIIEKIVEINNPVMRIINKTLGVLFGIALVLAIVMIVFSLSSLIGNGVEGTIYQSVKDSWFGLGKLYVNNPISNAIKSIIA